MLHQFHTEDPIREVKNNIIIFVSLCARAAVEGGVSLQVAKEMEEDYISRIERCSAIAGLAELNHSMIREFALRVAQCRENPGLSDTIQIAVPSAALGSAWAGPRPCWQLRT